MRRHLLTAAGLGGLALLMAGEALAWSSNGQRWSAEQMPVRYHVNNQLSTDVPDADALAAVQEGFNVWTEAPCASMSWDYAGRTDSTAWAESDGMNTVSWREQNWDQGGSVLAITSVFWNFQEVINDTDIKFNGVNHTWGALDGPGGRATDIASVSAHEVGHALGLDHSDVPGSTMWPSTGPGDISVRSLGRDDLEGVCEIYPNGGEVPDPGHDGGGAPGDGQLGDDCSATACAAGLFCVSDGRSSYCSQICTPGEGGCPDDFYCARLSGGDGACARGEDPTPPTAAFGEACGNNIGCDPGLSCINDTRETYCSGPCLNGGCPDGYTCVGLQSGGDICARGQDQGPRPAFGEPCTDQGVCDDGLFCLYDPLSTDENGVVEPYCTNGCDVACASGYRCVEVGGSGQACQRIPTAGQRGLGDECWVNPERPWDIPTCGDGLVCVDYRIEGNEVVEPGTCTRNCDAMDCCPEGWGCVELITFGQCIEGRADTPSLACEGERPGLEMPGAGGANGDGGIDVVDQDGGGGGGGCATVESSGGLIGFALLALMGLLRSGRRRRTP